jgi:hypothetical protein
METKTIPQIIDYLTYCSYRFNRLNSPDISPERWSKIFSNVEAMEVKIQLEKRVMKNVSN